jgi:hypothetical protein
MTTFVRTLVRALADSRSESTHDAPARKFLIALMRALAAPAV